MWSNKTKKASFIFFELGGIYLIFVAANLKPPILCAAMKKKLCVGIGLKIIDWCTRQSSVRSVALDPLYRIKSLKLTAKLEHILLFASLLD